MNQYAITYPSANRHAAVKVVDREGALEELERCLHFEHKISKAYTRKIRNLIDFGVAGETYEFFDGYIVVVANETAAERRGIEAARRAVAGIPHGTSWFSSFIEDALAAIDNIGDALTADAPETGGGE